MNGVEYLLLIPILLVFTFSISICLFQRKKQFKKIKGKPSGLKNDSPECFMNSIIQALASSGKMIEQYETISRDYPNNESLKHFVKLLKNVNKFDDSDQHLLENTDILRNLITSINWDRPLQQDAFELLCKLIDTIHQDLENIELPMTLKIVYQFKSINVKNEFRYHIGLSLELNKDCATEPGDTIENLIHQYFLPTIIDENPNKTQSRFLEKVPDILLLHFQAKRWNNEEGRMITQKYHIRYYQKMIFCFDIAKELNDENPKSIKADYKIKALVEYTRNNDKEHYVTYRNWMDKWFLVNDEEVQHIEFENNICPCIMIYEKC